MGAFAWVGMVSALALLVYYVTLLRAGMARGRFKIEPPAHTGPPEYERYVRAHQNTLEHLALFLPGLWMFAFAVDPRWAAGIGLIWPLARLWYAFGYAAEPKKRIPGLLISMPPIYIFVLGSLIGFGLKAFCGR
jgi:glutathione S-transferase